MNKDNILVSEIIEEINNERMEKFNLSKCFDDDRYLELMLKLFRNFYSDKVNDGVYAVIFNDGLIRDEIIKILFKNNDMMLDLLNDGNVIGDYDKKFFYTDGIDNYIYLEDKDILIKFNELELEILYKSKIGECFTVTLLFDEDGLVKERKIDKEILPIKIDNIIGYGCRSVITVSRNYIDPRYVVISDRLEIVSGNRVIDVFDRKCAGYINPLYLFDLGNELCLDDKEYDGVVNDALICKFFPGIKNKLNKNSDVLVRRYKSNK